MKYFLILFVLVVMTACTSQTTTHTAAETQSGAELEALKSTRNQYLPIGRWEGIKREFGEFHVLTINENKAHSFTSYKIASAMETQESISFSDKDVSCDEFGCTIRTDTAREKLPLKITLVPSTTGFFVTESIKVETGTLLASAYKLEKLNAIPTPQQFIAAESGALEQIISEHKTDRFGFWMGILETANEEKLKLVTLNYQPDQNAVLTVYSTGNSHKAIMYFKPEWLTQNNGELSTKLEGSLFASKITIRYPVRDVIEGDFEQRFERYPERLIAHGNFKLYRVKPAEDRKLPEWLKKALENSE